MTEHPLCLSTLTAQPQLLYPPKDHEAKWLCAEIGERNKTMKTNAQLTAQQLAYQRDNPMQTKHRLACAEVRRYIVGTQP